MKHPNGYVELPAEYVYEMATGAINLIKKQRDKNLRDAICEIKFDVLFRKLKERLGIYKCRTDEECIKILQGRSYGYWWVYFVSHFEDERYDQMKELAQAAKIGGIRMLVTTEIAAYFRKQEELND